MYKIKQVNFFNSILKSSLFLLAYQCKDGSLLLKNKKQFKVNFFSRISKTLFSSRVVIIYNYNYKLLLKNIDFNLVLSVLFLNFSNVYYLIKLNKFKKIYIYYLNNFFYINFFSFLLSFKYILYLRCR